MSLLVFTENSRKIEFCEKMSGKTLKLVSISCSTKEIYFKSKLFIDLPKIRTGDFSFLLKYLSLFPIKPQINLYVWTALSAIANVI